jgi:toxin ParE1/3/4
MRVIWSRRAIRHLTHVRDYTALENPESAKEVAARTLEAVDRLATYPNLGRPGRQPGMRELILPRTPYIIPYRIRGERVELIAVFHGRQRWTDLL